MSATLSAMSPDPAPVRSVLTLRTDVAAGAALTMGEVTDTNVPLNLVPDGAMFGPDEVTGRTAAIRLPRGAILTQHALVHIDAQGSAPPGRVLVPVRLSDPEILRFLGPGSHIDLLLVPTSSEVPQDARLAPTVVLARRALVLPTPAPVTPQAAGGLLGGPSPDENPAVVLVAVTPAEAQDVTASARSGYIGAVIVE